MPLLAAFLPPDPHAGTVALLKEIRAAKSIEIRHVDGDTILAKRIFKAADAKGTTLLAAIEGDFLKKPNDDVPKCGFHADVAIVTRVKRALKTELCFGCGVVQVEVPGPPFRRTVSWTMSDKTALKTAVHALYPGIKLGR